MHQQCYTLCHIHKIILSQLQNGLWGREWNCLDMSNLTFRNSERDCIAIEYCGLFTIFSAEHVNTGYINDGLTMVQRCIVDISIASTCSSWWSVARTRTTTPQKERLRQTDKNRKLFVTIDRGSNFMWSWTPLFGEIKHVKKYPKIPRNALFDALLKSCLQNFVADATKNITLCAVFWKSYIVRFW